MKAQQEVFVKNLFPSFEGGNERYDWVIEDASIIIEAHGIQHYQVQTFGGDGEQAIANFKSQQRRDAAKEQIARDHNWTYIIIPYKDEKILTPEYLLKVYRENKVDEPVVVPKVEKSKWELKQESYKEEQKERAKAYRKRQYQRAKELKKNRKYK